METLDKSKGPRAWRDNVREFIDKKIAEADERGDVISFRAPQLARDAIQEMPFGLVADAAYAGVAPFVRDDLKRRHTLIGIPPDEGEADDSPVRDQVVFKRHRQLEMTEAEEWLAMNFERRERDADAELKEVERFIEAHPEWGLSVPAFYAKCGVPMPE